MLGFYSRMNRRSCENAAEICINGDGHIDIRPVEHNVDPEITYRATLVVGLPREIGWTITIQDFTITDVIDTDIIRFHLGAPAMILPYYYQIGNRARRMNALQRAERAREFQRQFEQLSVRDTEPQLRTQTTPKQIIIGHHYNHVERNASRTV